MKKINLLLFCSFILAPVLLWCQGGGTNFRDAMLSPNADFYEISQKSNDFFTANPDSAEGGGYAEFKRWEWFWQTRVNKINGARGSFQFAQQAISSLLNNPIPICTNSNYSSWRLLGPKINMPTSPNWANMGRIRSMAVDPTNHNIIYAGSEAGGIFKTTNGLSGNPIWVNITNDLRLPGLGINDIKIDPTNSNVIFVATGYSASGSYSVGIIKSVDGGQIWTSINPISPSPNQMARKININQQTPPGIYLYQVIVNDEVFSVDKLIITQ